MVRAVALLAAVLAAAPAPAATLGFDDARHLLNRTSFAANTSDIETFARLTRAQAVERLLGVDGQARRHAAARLDRRAFSRRAGSAR